MDGSRTHPARFVAPAHWRAIDFISDLHLAEDTPRGFDAWSSYMLGTSADAVFMLGDLFEVWVGDDARHDGFEARCMKVLQRAVAERHVAFMAGNRDFMVGAAFLEACGVHRIVDPTLVEAFGTAAVVSHGDALCIDDIEYQAFRRMVRDPQWQAEQLRHPLAQRRALAQQMRSRSADAHAQRAPADWVDVDVATASQWLFDADARTLIHGHTHRPAHDRWPQGLQRYVLSDWELDHGPAPRADVLRWSAQGLHRIAVADAH